ncbi:glycosyltransferase family 4 protein [Lacticaseibacillus pantheris]|uniref:glycosyltransferase family 4 protein n=1 Tax=Lacticaseibacillus pantheris TaxID=171523 RepID=UPI00265A2B26|nr:glycosyltransferase [Lacticaseibacillus pantheris]WKF85001.1 glycosyltransferase [Lacticaseibacillus pantheris]
MIFFINSIMQANKSGIEFAQLKRIELFNDHNEDYRLVVRDWDPKLHPVTRAAGVPDSQLINMFEYFQNAMVVPEQPVHLADLDFGVLNTHADQEANRFLVYNANNQLVARVNFTGDDQVVTSTELFDGFGNLYRVDYYDTRGFRTLEQWYTPDNKIGTEAWLDVNGVPVVEKFYRTDNTGELAPTGWRLTDRNDGKVYMFDTIEELTLQFLNDLNAEYWSQEHPNVFVLDRGHVADWGLLHLDRPAYTVNHLHNAHASGQDPMAPIVNNNYEFTLNAINGYDAIVLSTHKQSADVDKRYHPTAKLFTIPVGVVPDRLLNAPRVPETERTFGKMVVFARIAPEKQLDQLTQAFAQVHDAVPEATLDLYGYADNSNNYAAKRAVQKVIDEHDLGDAVTFKGYTTDVDTAENDGMLYGLTSNMEGFNLAIMEAIAHGLIPVTYDVNYGPNEITEDHVNGRVVPYGDIDAFAQAVIEILQNPDLAQQYSTAAYDSAERYSEANVWQAWRALIDDADAIWPAKLAAARMTTVPAKGDN